MTVKTPWTPEFQEEVLDALEGLVSGCVGRSDLATQGAVCPSSVPTIQTLHRARAIIRKARGGL